MTAKTSDVVASLRSLTATFAASLVLFGVVLTRLPNLPNGPVFPWIPILGAIAVYTVVAPRFAERPLTCTSPATLAGAYRTRFFLRLAFAETTALFAFTFTFIGGPVWTYSLGAAFSLFRMATNAAPTPASLARDQQKLDAGGCTLSLVAALRGSSSPPTE
jgi:hypothetical protein